MKGVNKVVAERCWRELGSWRRPFGDHSTLQGDLLACSSLITPQPPQRMQRDTHTHREIRHREGGIQDKYILKENKLRIERERERWKEGESERKRK